MEEIDLVEILKDAPKGTKLYSVVSGVVELVKISQEDTQFPIIVRSVNNSFCVHYTRDAKYTLGGECCLFPSKKNRDWTTVQYKWQEYKKAVRIIIKKGKTDCDKCPFSNSGSICTVKSIKGIPDCKKYDLTTMEIVGFECEE